MDPIRGPAGITRRVLMAACPRHKVQSSYAGNRRSNVTGDRARGRTIRGPSIWTKDEKFRYRDPACRDPTSTRSIKENGQSRQAACVRDYSITLYVNKIELHDNPFVQGTLSCQDASYASLFGSIRLSLERIDRTLRCGLRAARDYLTWVKISRRGGVHVFLHSQNLVPAGSE